MSRENCAAYVELHCHSNFSFQEGASFPHELLARAAELGYPALALTDHDNLCGAMEFARTARSLGIHPIIGAEVTLSGSARTGVRGCPPDSSSSNRAGLASLEEEYHLTLLAETRQGYANLCRLISSSHVFGERRHPQLDPRMLPEHSQGLVALSGCRQGEVPKLAAEGRMEDAWEAARRHMEWFGPGNYFLELQQNLVYGDTPRNRRLISLAKELGVGVVATNNVHYHVPERHRLQDCLVAVKECKSLEDTHRQRRPNGQFYLKSATEMSALFDGCPDAVAATRNIADRCSFDLTKDLDYRFPDYPVPTGHTPDSYLQELCRQAAIRRYGTITSKVESRLEEEFRLIGKHGLSGFFLLYHEIIRMAREVQVELGLVDPEMPIEEAPPGRGRGSSVAMLVGYLIGLSHIDPLQYNLSLERFLPEDALPSVPDIDLDFPRNIREQLILRVHDKYGWDHAALSGMLDTYKLKGSVRDLGKALGLPSDRIDRLAKRAEHRGAKHLGEDMAAMPEFRDQVNAPVWRHLIDLAGQLDGFPKYLAQHPGGMIISSTPLINQVPVQKGAIDGRYVCHWDKDSIDDAGFVKIDFLALGALSQMQDALLLIEQRAGRAPDLSRIDFDDQAVYDMLHRADTVGIFQVESAAQMQTIPRIRPRNLTDMAHEVGAVRPGVGVNDGVSQYIRRRTGREQVSFHHPLEKRALERTYGVILFQDQVNQLAIDVAGFGAAEADQLRRAFTRRHNAPLVQAYWEKFREGSADNGVDEATAARIFQKFNGHYMFPESHAFAFGVTAYQGAWLKHYYPLEFYTAIFNQQPMGFYSPETLKEDARRHGVAVLLPDVNRSDIRCAIESEGGRGGGEAMRLGLNYVAGLGEVGTKAVAEARQRGGPFASLEDFMQRSGLLREQIESLVDGGALDCFSYDCHDRRALRWEVGLRYRPVGKQLALPLSVDQDRAVLDSLTAWERMQGEYRSLGLHPQSHVMAYLRSCLPEETITSQDIEGLEDGQEATVAGLIVRRQRPLAKAVFLTLEDEHGHIPCVVWPKVYGKLRRVLKESLIVAKGTASRREGTMNIVLTQARPIGQEIAAPRSKDWQ